MLSPISATLQKAYRDTLLCNASPSFLDTDEKIIPVAVIANASSPSNSQNVIITDGTDQALVTTGGRLFVSVEPSSTLSSERTYKCGHYLKASPTANTTYTAYTPTASKSLYITTLIVYANGANRIRVGDGLSGNQQVDVTLISNCLNFNLGSAADSFPTFITFPVPFKISTTLDFIPASTNAAGLSWVGFEE